MGHQWALGTPRGCRGNLGASGGVGVYWGLAWTLGTQGPEGVYRASGPLGAPRGVGGLFGGEESSRGVLEASSDCRYSYQKEYRGHQGHWGLLGGVGTIWGVRGVLGASRDSRCSGTEGYRGIGRLLGGVGSHLGASWVCEGCQGCIWG